MWYSLRLLNERAFALLLTGLAIGVRAYLASTLYLNADECMHANAGSSMQFASYHHPPLLFAWLWLATLVSDREWWLRLVPTLAGGLVPLMAGLWMRRFLSPVSAWGLAALLAVYALKVQESGLFGIFWRSSWRFCLSLAWRGSRWPRGCTSLPFWCGGQRRGDFCRFGREGSAWRLSSNLCCISWT